jgi:hypothetical protein
MAIGATGDKDSAASKSIKEFLRSYYNKYDSDNNHQMDIRELKMLFRDLGEQIFDWSRAGITRRTVSPF